MRGEMPPPPAATTLGISFKNIDVKIGAIEVEFEGKKEFTNPAGNIQGGFLAAKVGRLLGKGRVVKRGRGVCFLSAELYQDGEQVATATATALIRSLPR